MVLKLVPPILIFKKETLLNSLLIKLHWKKKCLLLCRIPLDRMIWCSNDKYMVTSVVLSILLDLKKQWLLFPYLLQAFLLALASRERDNTSCIKASILRLIEEFTFSSQLIPSVIIYLFEDYPIWHKNVRKDNKISEIVNLLP